mmetsp:Transcript_34504/g.87895  ORF Transcript_34504/g.87895 Transcript_34504/m.87895 type:complete len:208 (-) Transcript_34504:86-709(-)
MRLLLRLEILVQPRQDVTCMALFAFPLLSGLAAGLYKVRLRLRPASLLLDEPLLQHLLFPKLILIVLDKGAVLPELAFQVDLQALGLLLKETLEHGQELRRLNTWHLALPRILCDDLRALREHLREALFAFFLVVLESQLLFLFYVPWDVEAVEGPNLKVLEHEPQPSARLIEARCVEDLLVKHRLDIQRRSLGDRHREFRALRHVD